MLVPLLLSLAHAGEIVIVADVPVSVEVDGRIVPSRPGERGATAGDLAGGNHRVQVFDAQDRLLTSAAVTVPVTDQVRLELRRGQLVELGRGPLPSLTVTCPEPPPAPAPAPGVFQLTGISPTDVAVWVDGRPVSASATGFVAKNLPAGDHDVRVAQGSRTLYAGTMRIYPELVRQCVPDRSALDCVMVEELVSISPPPPPAPPPVVTKPVPAPPPAPVAMASSEFSGFVAAVKKESFSSDQLALIETVAKRNWFTIAQVGAVLDTLPHSSDKVAAARILAPKVIDRENAWKLNEHLTFSSDKDAVQALFR